MYCITYPEFLYKQPTSCALDVAIFFIDFHLFNKKMTKSRNNFIFLEVLGHQHILPSNPKLSCFFEVLFWSPIILHWDVAEYNQRFMISLHSVLN